jgi:uncharacterized protein (TIGR02145 family)
LLFAFLYINPSNAQNVGIGTTTPGFSLEIRDSSFVGPVVRLNNPSTQGLINGILLSRQGVDKWLAGMRFSSSNYSITSNIYEDVFEIDSTGRVGIGTASPAASAKLEINSTTQGFLPPRLTIAQRNAISTPAKGLVIFCTECDELEVFNGASWKNMIGTGACFISIPPNIKICDQTWMTNNLDVSNYRNGDPIPQVTDPNEWNNLTTGAWCWYNNDSLNYASTYGKLYNWFAVNDPRGLAPQGWHVPSDAEWSTLSTCLGGDAVAGSKMKETGTLHWSQNTGATNSSGFAGLPGGSRGNFGTFSFVGYYGNFWSSTEYIVASQSPYAWNRYLSYSNGSISRSFDFKKYGYSVRCLRD